MTDLLVDLASTYRLTRLLTRDDVLNRPRDAIVRFAYRWRFDEAKMPADPETRAAWDTLPGTWSRHASTDPHPPPLALLATCPWCLSVYGAAFLLAASAVAPRVARPLKRVLAMSAAAGLLAGWER